MIKYGIIGSGWRSEFYLRISNELPKLFKCKGVYGRNKKKLDTLKAQFSIPVFNNLSDFINIEEFDFIITSVPWDINPNMIETLVKKNIPVLTETPPAPTIDALKSLYEICKQGAKIQVAEQFFLQPHHFARQTFVDSGKLGEISRVVASVGHGYHGISLLRKLLNVGFEQVKITGSSHTFSVIQGSGREGPPDEKSFAEYHQQTQNFQWKNKLGVSDFNNQQYFSNIRSRHILIQGTEGEIHDDSISYMKDFKTPIKIDLKRHEAGIMGNLDGFYLKGIQAGENWLYINEFEGAKLTDEEIAMARVMVGMKNYIETGVDIYSLANGCHDHYLNLLAQESISQQKMNHSEEMPWN